ncbi:MAG: hypothetical protein WC641_01480 [Patescibacteria group bacterium]
MKIRESLRIPETQKVRLMSEIFKSRSAEAQAALSAAEARGADKDELDKLKAEIEVAEKERELFFWERDVTGAAKADKFYVDLRQRVGELGLQRVESGELDIPEKTAQDSLLIVNLSELDRLNDSGDHNLGDIGLEQTFAHISRTVVEHLRTQLKDASEEEIMAHHEIYRISGNDFGVHLKEVSPALGQAIMRDLNSAPFKLEGYPDEDPVPLVAVGLDFENAARTLELLPTREEGDVGRELVKVLREKAQTFSDYEKIRSRFGRVAEKIMHPSGRLEAREFYDKYLKKSLGVVFGGNEALDFDGFRAKLQENGALEDDGDEVKRENWKNRAFHLARDQAIALFKSRNAENLAAMSGILERAVSELESGSGLTFNEAEKFKPQLEQGEVGENLAVREDLERFRQKTEFLGRTESEVLLEGLEKKLAETEDLEEDDPHRKIAQLDAQIAKAQRSGALFGRGKLFMQLEKGLVEKEPSVISIDMAFLKYFDKEGGTRTGEAAIGTAMRILDFAKREFKAKHPEIQAEAYRVGGDEFVLYVESDRDEHLKEIANLVDAARRKAGPIPAHPGALPTYQPEFLHFNLGIATARRAPGEASKDRDVHRESNDVLREADKQIEGPKALERFALLLQLGLRADKAPLEQKAALSMKFTTLSAYSEKALGRDGRRLLYAWLEEIKQGKSDLAEVLRTKAMPYVSEALKNKGKHEIMDEKVTDEILERVIEGEINEQRIAELEQGIEDFAARLGAEHGATRELQKQVSAIKELRGKIANA